jgi:hypothetical protein
MAERRAAQVMLKAKRKGADHRITAAADKAYDTKDDVKNLRAGGVTPRVAQNNGRCIFGWGNAAWRDAHGNAPRNRPCRQRILLRLIAHNLIRIPKLVAT